MSWRILVLVGTALAVVLGVLHWRSDRPEYDPEQLMELRQIFDQRTQVLRKGELGYDLPKPEVARRELAYLTDLAELLEDQPPDCAATESALLERHAAHQGQARASMFKQAYQIWAERQGQDFVQDLSDEVSMGRTFKARPLIPTSTDKKLSLLREKTARIALVDAGLGILTRLARAARTFGEACPIESGALHTALGTLGN